MLPGYVVRRVLWIIPVLVGIATITFVLMRFVPGGPWDDGKPLPPQMVENLNRHYGLDEPLWRQYWNYLTNAIQGDLGVSYGYQNREVIQIIRERLPTTATLGGIAFVIALGLGVPLGMLSALKKNSPVDYLSMFLATLFASVPGFVLALLLIILFSVQWHLLPAIGWGSPSQVIMPALALAALPMAFIARVTRASVLESLGQDYVRTAEAKGLPPHLVHYRHVLRNALIPVLTVLGPELAVLITGSFIIEDVFAIPGIGRLFVQAVFARDYGLIMGMVLFYSLVIAALNLLVDLLYAVVDPRIHYG